MGSLQPQTKIEQMNLVNHTNEVMPNYDLSQREVSIELHFSPQKEVCIIGRVDNNYLCWFSLTRLDELEVNEKIFNYLANFDFKQVSNEYEVLGNEKYHEWATWYSCKIIKSMQEGVRWETPFGQNYGERDPENHGRYFARNLIRFYDGLLEKCSFRLAGRLYFNQLRHYHTLLTEAEEYMEIEPLIALLKEESYLRLSPDEAVRELYFMCMERGRQLYNHYMNQVR